MRYDDWTKFAWPMMVVDVNQPLTRQSFAVVLCGSPVQAATTYLDCPSEYLMYGASSQIGSSTIKYLVRYINKTTLVIPKRYLNSDSLACLIGDPVLFS